MDITELYVIIMQSITPTIVLAGMLALTICVIAMLINMIIDAFTGKGFRIGSR